MGGQNDGRNGRLPHIVLLISGFHEIEREPFGHFSGQKIHSEQESFRKLPSRSCVKIAVCNWAPDVHRMYDYQVEKKKDGRGDLRSSVSAGSGDPRRTKTRFVHQRLAC